MFKGDFFFSLPWLLYIDACVALDETVEKLWNSDNSYVIDNWMECC